jgi:DNA-binding transcriptional ArsR family regulator
MVVDTLGTALAALSDPTRRSIVDRLTRGPAPVSELARPFAMSQQAISKHVAYLERAHLIHKRRAGRQHLCALNPHALRAVAQWAEGYRRVWEENFHRLDVLLDEMKTPRKRARSTKGDGS